MANAHHSSGKLRVGLGLLFHISPSNVPINFAFSLVFGLLTGNVCVVRLSSRNTPTETVIISSVTKLLKSDKFRHLRSGIHLIKYEKDDEINSFWLSQADGRIVWGGDTTVSHMRSFLSKPRSREIAFSDRYSFSVIGASGILKSTADELKQLCENAFNDIYLMDQYACSSPQLLVWLGDGAEVERAKMKFWSCFYEHVRSRFRMEPIDVMNKFVEIHQNVIGNDNIARIDNYKNLVCRVEIDKLSVNQQEQRGHYGTVHEVSVPSLGDLAPLVTERCQTLTYFGVDRDQLQSFLISNHLRGIDRIVPIGSALDMNFYWDGYDIISSLSRVVDVQ